MKHTKIVATIGPASENKKILTEMVKEGMNVARLNFSHGDFDSHKKAIKMIRSVAKSLKTSVGIMADLQGPRIRVANQQEFVVKKGEEIRITETLGRAKSQDKLKMLVIDLPNVVKLVRSGSDVLIEDGLIKLKVTEKKANYLKAVAVNDGLIKSKKGINIPGISGKLGALTKKDREYLNFALSQDVDYVAMSFVRSAKEIKQLKALIKRKVNPNKGLPQVVAKIERREAVKNFDEILRATDGVMVARGDLGIEMPQSDLPILQKEIVFKSLRAAKPVIVATQMLDSMIRNPRPTRAEVSDVSNAVIDHTDAVMLSGESANGKYPVESVRTMREIIEKTEASSFDDLPHGFLTDKKTSISAAVAQSAHELLKDSSAKAIVVASVSGFTARMITRHRPDQMILVITNNEKTSNQLSLVWGALSFILPDCHDLDELLDKSIEVLKGRRMLKKKDRVVIVAGRPHLKKEHMSLVKIEEVQ